MNNLLNLSKEDCIEFLHRCFDTQTDVSKGYVLVGFGKDYPPMFSFTGYDKEKESYYNRENMPELEIKMIPVKDIKEKIVSLINSGKYVFAGFDYNPELGLRPILLEKEVK